MEEFRKKLQRKALISTVICSLAPVIFIVLQIVTKRAVDYASGVMYGFFTSIIAGTIINITRIYSVLRNEEELKKMYIKETDERNIMLNKETSNTSLWIITMGISFAVLITSFFSKEISMTLAVALCFMVIVTFITRAYYNKKM